jgi:hypothetical protein
MFRFLGTVGFLMAALTLVGAGQAAAQTCIPIKSVQDLQNIQNHLSGTYCLTKDIDATGMPAILPIGDGNNLFVGQFDGQGHTIKGLTITTGSRIYVGLFAIVGTGGMISNIGLIDLNVSAPVGYNVGGLAGRNHGTINNSYTTGSVAGTAGNLTPDHNGIAIAGLVGWNFGTITQSYSAASVTSPTTAQVSMGGLAGGDGGTISGSYATGPVSGSSSVGFSQFVGIGGLVGWVDPTGQIVDSHATGAITGSGIDPGLGGLVGFLHGGTVSKSFATGEINGGVSVTLSGGLVGASITMVQSRNPSRLGM